MRLGKRIIKNYTIYILEKIMIIILEKLNCYNYNTRKKIIENYTIYILEKIMRLE